MEPIQKNHHIYVINMTKRRDRKTIMEYKLRKIKENKLCENYFDDITFFEGIDGSLQKYNTIFRYGRIKGKIKTRGELGLFLTYVELIKDANLKKYSYIIIFEDDINFHKDFCHLWQNYMTVFNDQKNEIHKAYLESDIIWLGANQDAFTDEQNKISKKDEYYPVVNKIWTYGTYSILLKRKAIDTLNNYFKIVGTDVIEPVDNLINKLIRENYLKGIVLSPNLTIPDVTDSNTREGRNQYSFLNKREIDLNEYNFYNIKNINHSVSMIKDIINKSELKIEEHDSNALLIFLTNSSGDIKDVFEAILIESNDNLVNLSGLICELICQNH